MPYKPKKPCAHPGCPKLTDKRFCEEHSKAETRRYNKHQRDPAINKRYGAEWKKIRNRYIKARPLCEKCEADGRLTPAREVHHITPLADGGTHAESNLIALCQSCHSRLHAERGDRWKRGGGGAV